MTSRRLNFSKRSTRPLPSLSSSSPLKEVDEEFSESALRATVTSRTKWIEPSYYDPVSQKSSVRSTHKNGWKNSTLASGTMNFTQANDSVAPSPTSLSTCFSKEDTFSVATMMKEDDIISVASNISRLRAKQKSLRMHTSNLLNEFRRKSRRFSSQNSVASDWSVCVPKHVVVEAAEESTYPVEQDGVLSSTTDELERRLSEVHKELITMRRMMRNLSLLFCIVLCLQHKSYIVGLAQQLVWYILESHYDIRPSDLALLVNSKKRNQTLPKEFNSFFRDTRRNELDAVPVVFTADGKWNEFTILLSDSDSSFEESIAEDKNDDVSQESKCNTTIEEIEENFQSDEQEIKTTAPVFAFDIQDDDIALWLSQ